MSLCTFHHTHSHIFSLHENHSLHYPQCTWTDCCELPVMDKSTAFKGSKTQRSSEWRPQEAALQSETFNLEISGQRLVNRMLKNKKQQHKLPPEPNHRACSLAALHLRRYQGMAAILDSNHREFHSQTHTHTPCSRPYVQQRGTDRRRNQTHPQAADRSSWSPAV